MSYSEIVCKIFDEVVEKLKRTHKECCREEVLETVNEAIQELCSVYRPLLDGYYAKEYC